jgi:hypothetical protein
MSASAILANVATPLLFPQPLLACLALVPIIIIETCLLRQAGSFRWRDVSVANILSTIVGVPVAFFCMVVLGFGFGIIVDQVYATLGAVVLFLAAVILPCFALSVYLEGSYLRRRARGLNGRAYWYAITRAHCYSYLGLLLIYCLWISRQL